MNIRQQSFFPARYILALLIVAMSWSVPAQEDMDEAAEPAVNTSAPATGVTQQQTDSQVMDRIELDTAEITGNQELPRVLYIVPWQDPDAGELPGPPVGTLLDEVATPLDREEFTRWVAYSDEPPAKQE